MSLVVVDGPNVYNDAGRYLASSTLKPDKAYFERWFDIDRLVRATAPEVDLWQPNDLGIVVVHSRNQLGDKHNVNFLSGGDQVDPFWSRQGTNPRTSSLLVEVPGAGGKKEVGVDVAIVTYLFETMDSWNLAILFAADADFVPAVWSLRRKGKRMLCASRDITGPLVQACQDHRAWDTRFLDADVAMEQALKPDGPFDAFLRSIESKHPRVSAKGHRLTVLSNVRAEFDGSEQNRMRQAFQPLSELGYAPRGNPQAAPQLSLDPDGGLSTKCAEMLIDGVRRQASRPPNAFWKRIFEPNL